MIRKSVAGADDNGFNVFEIENPSVENDDGGTVFNIEFCVEYTVDGAQRAVNFADVGVGLHRFNPECFGACILAQTAGSGGERGENEQGFQNCFHARKYKEPAGKWNCRIPENVPVLQLAHQRQGEYSAPAGRLVEFVECKFEVFIGKSGGVRMLFRVEVDEV